MRGSQIESIVRDQTGLGPLTTSQANYLQIVMRAAFYSESTVLVMYLEGQKMTIYLMPTDTPDEMNPSKSPPMSKQKYEQHKNKAQEWLSKLLDKSKDFAGLRAFYDFKIVLDLPAYVRNSEKLAWQSNP